MTFMKNRDECNDSYDEQGERDDFYDEQRESV